MHPTSGHVRLMMSPSRSVQPSVACQLTWQPMMETQAAAGKATTGARPPQPPFPPQRSLRARLAGVAAHDAHEAPQQLLVVRPRQRPGRGRQRGDRRGDHIGLAVAVQLLQLVPAALRRFACAGAGETAAGETQ